MAKARTGKLPRSRANPQLAGHQPESPSASWVRS